jgi:hypothetical protein
MFYYDLVTRHRRVLGGPELFAGCERHLDAGAIPLHEATRLLMNRCSGLLFTAERLARREFGPDEADFAGRNLAKAQLAFGDVLLTARGQYDWSCRTRHERLRAMDWTGELAWAEPLVAHHAEGVRFKFDPVRSTAARAELAERHAGLSELGRRLWLWLESRRLGRAFASVAGYVDPAVDKCPETPGWRNRLVNARQFGVGAAWAAGGNRYPRQRLLHALPLLLWQPGVLTEASWRSRVQAELRTGANDLAGLVAAYGGLWGRFN